jgi:hypothetical protein
LEVTPEAIPGEVHAQLLEALEIGAPIAEDDNLLFDARVETSAFGDVLNDRVDIVRGTKGSGKTALFRIFTVFLRSHMRQTQRVVMVKGVEPSGDPVFQKFKPEFEKLDEIDFENFWRVYFVSVISTQFLSAAEFQDVLAPHKAEIRTFHKVAQDQGFPVQQSPYALSDLVGWALRSIPRPARIDFTVGSDGLVPQFEAGVDLTAGVSSEARVPLFVAELQNRLLSILERAGIRIWVMLDRLDEVFPRRSPVERTALRALLRTTLGFRNPRLRIKVFLRDDIFGSVTEATEGFPALTHVMARCSDTLQWSRDQILQLIVQRAFSRRLATYFGVDRERLRTDAQYRREMFYKIFPARLRPGKNQSQTLDWLWTHCEDSNGVVTPRDIIDLITLAKRHQRDINAAHIAPMATILSSAAILHGHHQMSLRKRDTYLRAEFPHFWEYLERFEGRKAEHDATSLEMILGPSWNKIIVDLKSIGFMKYSARSNTYSIPFLYRPCLQLRQGKAVAKN